MNPVEAFDALLQDKRPLLALAPMKDVTDLAFWRVMSRRSPPDVVWTEYFRAHSVSRPEWWIAESITENPTGCPVVAQVIGDDIPALVRTVRQLQRLPVAAIDLNLGCPAPVVWRKGAGGGLLRVPDRIDSILGALRDAVQVRFTVKTRVGFESPEEFDRLLAIFQKHPLDLLTVHGRTVRQMYSGGVRHDLAALAARELKCPVLANGDIHSPDQSLQLIQSAGLRGVMIGRGAVRNPWLFGQIRQRWLGETAVRPTGREVLEYVRELWDAACDPIVREDAQVQRMKKYTNFLGAGIGPASGFLWEIQRVATRADFFSVCERYLNHDDPMSLSPEV